MAKELVDLSCNYCGKEFKGEEPLVCCSGRECGCMGLPTEPVVCSKECYEKGEKEGWLHLWGKKENQSVTQG